MPESKRTLPILLHILVDGESVPARPGTTLAALLMQRGSAFRRSVTGEVRQPLCAMGTCFECRVNVDGVPHVRACRVVARDGMIVGTASGKE